MSAKIEDMEEIVDKKEPTNYGSSVSPTDKML